jgi:glycosyltransferase involved in cell wall biosynthesis
MRIAYVLTSLGMGGAERQVVALAERMAERGHSVALVVLRPPQGEEWPINSAYLPPAHLVRLKMRKNPLSILAGLIEARQSLRAFQPDLLHSHVFPANMAARLLKLLLPRLPVLSTVHNVYEGGRLRMLAYRLTDRFSCRTVAVSQAARDRYVRLKAIPAAKAFVVTNGIDTAEFAPEPGRRPRVRAEMGAGNDFIWLTAGRIVPAKDYPNLLSAFAELRKSNPQAQLWIAGESSGAASAAIQAQSAISVRWQGLRRDMPALLDAADGFVLGSAWEGMPLALGEAMAMAKPIVATDVGGVRELAGDCGAIVPAKNPEALAEAMLQTMRQSEQQRRAQGALARQRIEQHFSIDAKAAEWESLYRDLLEPKR